MPAKTNTTEYETVVVGAAYLVKNILRKLGFGSALDKIIRVGGRNVELHYRDYRFVGSFPANKDCPPTEIKDLRPSFMADD